MIERGQDPGLAIEADEAIWIQRELRGQRLDRDVAAETRIARAPAQL
jgi:hypothetical protein